MKRENIYPIFELLRSVNKTINRGVGCKVGFKNMNSSMLGVIFHLMESPPKTLKELSTGVGLANSTVSGIVDKLVEEGLLERVQDEYDRRRVMISVSQRALDIKKEIESKYMDYINEMFKDVSMEDVKLITSGLTRLNEIIKGRE